MRKLPALFVASILTLSGCGADDTTAKKTEAVEAIAVSLAATKVEPLDRTVEVIGTLYGDEETTISAKVPGRVTEIFLDVGDRVADGQALAQIDTTDYELYRTQAQMAVAQPLAKLGLAAMPDEAFDISKVSTVQQKRLEAANAQARFGRAEKLFKQKPPLISEQDYADQKTTFEVAGSAYDVALLEAKALLAEARAKQSDLGLAEQRLADTTLRAPQIAGAATRPTTHPAGRFGVASRTASVGEYVREGAAIFRLVADHPIKYRASVPERFVGRIKVGQRVDVLVEAVPEPSAGVVARINPQIDQASRSFQVEITVPNEKGLLRPGAFARGSIRTSTDPQVTFAPAKAVISFAGINKLFTVKDGKAAEARVAVGMRKGDWVEIVSGLQGEQQVVVDGAAKLANGIPVKVSESATGPSSRPAMAESK